MGLERNDGIAIAKAIGIILMVLCHTWFSVPIEKWVLMFHMPLFYFFSGYCMSWNSLNEGFFIFLKKRIKGLYLPWLKWGLVFLIFHNFFYEIHIYDGVYGYNGVPSHLYSIKEILGKALRIILIMTENEQLLGGYWFLRTLLIGSVVGFLVAKFFKPLYGFVSLLCLTIFFCLINQSIFTIGTKDVFCAFFFYIGYLYNNSKLKLEKNSFIFLISVLLVTMGAFFWPTAALSLRVCWKIVPYSISAFAGTIMVFYIANKISVKNNLLSKFLVYVGFNTLPILTWHFLSFKIVSLMIIYIYDLPIGRLAEYPVIVSYSQKGWFLLYLFVGIFIPLFLSRSKWFR